jgi:hypothetical protein
MNKSPSQTSTNSNNSNPNDPKSNVNLFNMFGTNVGGGGSQPQQQSMPKQPGQGIAPINTGTPNKTQDPFN